MKAIFLVGIGGGIGSIIRYWVGLWLPITATGFPTSTLIVNSVGSFIIGLALGYFQKETLNTNSLQLLLVTGFCGGFTTFSTFSKESFELLKNNQLGLCLFSIFASLSIGILATFVGYLISK